MEKNNSQKNKLLNFPYIFNKITFSIKTLLLFALIIVFAAGCDETTLSDMELQKSLSTAKTTKWDTIMQRGELIIGVKNLYESFDNDLLDAFAKELPIDIKKVVIDWDNRKEALDSEEVDFLWGQIPDTSENSVLSNLSLPHVKGSTVVVVKTANYDTPVSVGVLDSTADFDVAKSYFKQIEKYKDINSLFNALSWEQIDAAVINEDIYENSRVYKDLYKIIDDYEYNLVFEFRHGDNDIKTEVERLMAKVQGDNTASEISEKWFGKDLIIK